MMEVPIPTLHLFLPLDQKLIELLKSLSSADWNKKTVASLWIVKDVVAHLLDGNIRTLAAAQNYTGDPPDSISSYQGLVEYLNRLNADWVKAMKRVSPNSLIELLEVTQKPCIEYYYSLDLWATARFAVSWAGEQESKNWFHIAREYTERWHHQQQIRDAVHKQGIMDRKFFFPLIQTFMEALPHTYQNIQAEDGTSISVTVTGEVGGEWKIKRERLRWTFSDDPGEIATKIELDPDTSWKLFTNALKKEEAAEKVKISGNQELGLPLLKMLSVMA
jgi:Mycothiol maleylpyruvate isomerase N-terminal domain